ncbi:TonB-dependent receptor plug domain-containing protein [Aquimarina sp. 2-A2]|uniref:TonB-dependent receptor plug domain-containing protein n=1 Tax=Aquimarina sp. 2-A2 TaxID=3382644 RepID=UPI00387F28CD
MRLFIFLLFSVFLSHSVSAQQITVVSVLDKLPVPNVAIYNEAKTKSTLTNFDGVADVSVFETKEVLFFAHVSHLPISFTKESILKNQGIVALEVDENQLSEVVISVSKWKQDKKDIVQKIVSITEEDIALSAAQTSADLLQSSGQVYVQKSQLGGGSPIIRGFSTNRLLIAVDGVRMNTAIFRGGNVQNIISIDPFSIRRTEVILGPGSVVYGSDAVGGVMNFYTLKPSFAFADDNVISGNATARYATANNEKTGHVDLNFGFKNWAFLSSISYSDFDDLTMGSHGPDEYLRRDYVDTSGNTDIIRENTNPEKQVATGYDQINFMQKARFMPNERWNFELGLIYTTTSDYPRYDRLIRRRNGNLRSAEWYYGPQRWFMGNLQVTHKNGSKYYDNVQFTAAYQIFEESRNDRDFESSILSKTAEHVDAYSTNIDFEKKLSTDTFLHYGAEYILNTVNSKGYAIDITANTKEAAPSRYPDGSSWQSAAAYLSLKHKFNERVRLQTGLRYNYINVKSTFSDQFYDFPFEEANINTGALTGTAGISWLPNEILQWKVNFSTAFRAPNIDDVGKIFDSEPGAVVVPNPDLKPEYAYNGEIAVALTPSKKLTLDIATFYTYLDDALVRRDYALNGATQIMYKEELSTIQAIQNAANAKVYGFEAGINYSFATNFTITSQYTFTGGEEELDNGEIAPSRHVAPQFGMTQLTFDKDKLRLDLFANYNGSLSYDQLSPSEQSKDYLYAADANGNPYAPSWYTLNIRANYEILQGLRATFAIENITDQRYRTYSSGIAAAGRNFISSLNYAF